MFSFTFIIFHTNLVVTTALNHLHSYSLQQTLQPTKKYSILRLVIETRVIALAQAGTQASQFASAIDRAGNITNFTKNHVSKSFFFRDDSKEICP